MVGSCSRRTRNSPSQPSGTATTARKPRRFNVSRTSDGRCTSRQSAPDFTIKCASSSQTEGGPIQLCAKKAQSGARPPDDSGKTYYCRQDRSYCPETLVAVGSRPPGRCSDPTARGLQRLDGRFF